MLLLLHWIYFASFISQVQKLERLSVQHINDGLLSSQVYRPHWSFSLCTNVKIFFFTQRVAWWSMITAINNVLLLYQIWKSVVDMPSFIIFCIWKKRLKCYYSQHCLSGTSVGCTWLAEVHLVSLTVCYLLFKVTWQRSVKYWVLSQVWAHRNENLVVKSCIQMFLSLENRRRKLF